RKIVQEFALSGSSIDTVLKREVVSLSLQHARQSGMPPSSLLFLRRPVVSSHSAVTRGIQDERTLHRGGRALRWLVRTPDKREVGSSSLPRPTILGAGASTLL